MNADQRMLIAAHRKVLYAVSPYNWHPAIRMHRVTYQHDGILAKRTPLPPCIRLRLVLTLLREHELLEPRQGSLG